MLLAADRHAKAAELVDELLAGLPGRLLNPNLGVDLAVDLVKLGRPSGALEQVRPSPWLAAARALVAGDPEQAAKTYAVIGSRPDEAYARVQVARRLLAAGHAAEADAELVIAAAFYRDVGVSADLAQ